MAPLPATRQVGARAASEVLPQTPQLEFSVPLRAGAKPAPGVLGLGDAKPLLAPTPPQMVVQIPKVIDLWKDATVGSLLNMKACYHNIIAEEQTQALLGVTT